MLKRSAKGKGRSAAASAPRWLPTEARVSKVNVDGVVSRNGTRGSFTAVARNSLGVYLGSSLVLVEGLRTPEILETMACREGLALAADLNLSHVKLPTIVKA